MRKLRTPGGPRWFNLNSLQRSPTPLGDFYIAAFLAQMKAEGYSIFVVLPGPLGHLPNPIDASQGAPSCWLRAADVLARGDAGADVRRSAAERARQSAEADPEFEAALAASLAESGDATGGAAAHKRVRRDGGAEDSELREALRLSLLASSGGGGAGAAPWQPGGDGSSGGDSAAADAEALAAAVALSLAGPGGGASAEAAGVSEDAVVAEMLRLRAALAPEPPPGAGTARLQVRVPPVPPRVVVAGASSAAAAAGPGRPQQRRFVAGAPIADVFDWAALAWLEAAYPHLAAAGAPASAAPAAFPWPPFSLVASLAPPLTLRSDSPADRALTVSAVGLLPSATLALRC